MFQAYALNRSMLYNILPDMVPFENMVQVYFIKSLKKSKCMYSIGDQNIIFNKVGRFRIATTL